MPKALKINLNSQREIQQEGTQVSASTLDNSVLQVGRIKTEFFLPELNLTSVEKSAQKSTPQVQQVVSRINKFIENIADDYFLLGLHLISLHSLLKESKLNTEQIKSWYAENINMPYSSAMQCRKVAEVYSIDPELIGRYTASGAYLLSSCKTPEEREEIWQEARGEKPAPSIRELRETLKRVRERQDAEQLELTDLKNNRAAIVNEFRMSPAKIQESLQTISHYCDSFAACEQPSKQAEMREVLLESLRIFLKDLEKKT
ncbi:MAG: hypothetical protein H8E38_12980 [SAR324 cluster bacterium]|nr:hypothetical protein [SAR324 cluster bacterium]